MKLWLALWLILSCPGVIWAESWVKEISVCSGGWNGSADYQRFDHTGLQRYRVNKNGDLVFPDDTVWYKSEGYAQAHAGGVSAWESARDNSNIDDCSDNDAQYEYAQNKPSALAIADAGDGVKNLLSGPAGTHKKEDGYYVDNALSWSRDIGNGKGKSRLPTIAEYQNVREGLFNETKNYSQYQWSGEQDEELFFVRSYAPDGAKEGRELVNYPFAGCWVVEN